MLKYHICDIFIINTIQYSLYVIEYEVQLQFLSKTYTCSVTFTVLYK